MQRGLQRADKMIAVISDAYFKSGFATSEWGAAFAHDPDGMKRTLIPVRVENCDVSGLAKPFIYIDLVGCDEDVAREKLLKGVQGKRLKPQTPPKFPGSTEKSAKPPIIRTSSDKPRPATKTGTDDDVYIPPVKKKWTDRDKDSLLREGFENIYAYFEKTTRALQRQHPEIEIELEKITSRKFTCRIYIAGDAKATCKIWISQNHGWNQIGYAEGPHIQMDQDSSYNEALSVNDRDGQLFLNATMSMLHGTGQNFDRERLTGPQAAEYLWKRFSSRLAA